MVFNITHQTKTLIDHIITDQNNGKINQTKQW